MTKVLVASAVAAMALMASVPAASAASARGPYVSGHFYPNPLAFSRSVSYGVGYHGAGSLTGGPAGGLPSRN